MDCSDAVFAIQAAGAIPACLPTSGVDSLLGDPAVGNLWRAPGTVAQAAELFRRIVTQAYETFAATYSKLLYVATMTNLERDNLQIRYWLGCKFGSNRNRDRHAQSRSVSLHATYVSILSVPLLAASHVS